jgi:hypothetical protein
MSFCPVYDWDYTNMKGVVHYNCIPLIYWIPYFVAGLVVGLLPFIWLKIRLRRIKKEKS